MIISSLILAKGFCFTHCDQIEIFDTERETLTPSNCMLPTDLRPDIHKDIVYTSFIADLSDEIVNGYLRVSWKDLLPMDLITIIVDMYDGEFIHLVDRKSGKQWKISVTAVLG